MLDAVVNNFGSTTGVSGRQSVVVKRGGTWVFWTAKRALDLLLAVVLLPVLLLACLFVLGMNPSRNPGPLVFSQMRVGKNQKPFRIYKLRTMVGENVAAKFASEEKSRITPFGHFLRNKRIDELPQIWNILKGEMSFIGPRPEQENFVASYTKEIVRYDQRHLVRPGISGLAQVEHGYTDDAEGTKGKVKYDLTYIRNAGFRMEAYVVFKTIKTVITGYGAL